VCWTVYLCTYIGANLVENACVQFLGISPVLPKFFGSTLCNMAACIYKDQAVAKIYGKRSPGAALPFHTGIGCHWPPFLRDVTLILRSLRSCAVKLTASPGPGKKQKAGEEKPFTAACYVLFGAQDSPNLWGQPVSA
jgi:hypothetical protein